MLSKLKSVHQQNDFCDYVFSNQPFMEKFVYQKQTQFLSARYYSISKSNKISFDQGSELKTPQPILPHLRVKRSLTHKMVSRDIFLISGLRNLGSKKICTFENYGLGIIWFLIQYRKLLIHFLFDSLQIIYRELLQRFTGRPYTIAAQQLEAALDALNQNPKLD